MDADDAADDAVEWLLLLGPCLLETVMLGCCSFKQTQHWDDYIDDAC